MKLSKNVASPKEMNLRIDRFRGIDLSVPPVNVKPYRAARMKNLICDEGLTRKRNGWREIFSIKGGSINGVFPYENGGHSVLIVHAGKRFYEAAEGERGYSVKDITLSSSYGTARCEVSLLQDRRSQAFKSKGRMYIVGAGDYLVYGTWDEGASYELRRVTEDVDTFVPTTTISIDADGVTDLARSTLDDVNVLTRKRKNMLMGKDDSADGTANVSWTLDAEVDTSKLLTIEGSGWDLRNRLNFTAYGGYMLYNLRIESEGEDLYVKSMDGHEGAGAPGTPSFVPYRRKCGYIEGNKIVLYFGFTKVHSGVIDNNMTVTFYAEGESRAERVTKARFGTMFGVGGNSDRLFVAGNPAHKNIDFYSESDDLTYFSDRASSAVGSGGSAIMGYGRISDNTLAIYKSDALHEPTVFYRTGSNREEYDENGVLSKITALFPTFGGSDGEGLVSNFASANLAGDPMILSKNGVFGIEPSENAAVPDRYTRERSRPIRKKLTAHMLSEAVGTVFENRYYLAVGGEIFIADPRYKYRGDDSAEVSYNYEWWVWDNCPVRVFANVWDFLGFGTEDGRVCVFDDKYTDRTFSKFEAGDLALDISAGSVTYNEVIGLSIKDGDLIEFQTQGIYGCLDDLITVENGRLCANEETILSLHDGMEVYADNVGDSGLYAEQAYFITDIDRGDMTYRLMDGMGVYINPTEGGFSLHRMLSSKPLYIAELGEEAFFVREYKEGAVIKLSGYNGSVPTTPIATVTHFEAVKAEWVTPVFDLGTTEYGKSLRRMTVTMSPEQNGRLSFGYETREARRLAAAAGIGSFSLEDLSFVDFSLDTGFAGSYSVPCCERQFNYILFRFISEDDRGCAVTGFTATYTITPIRTRGVR